MSSHQRFFYIDALKAFAMMLVVLGHLAQFSPFQDTFYSSFVGIFHMPLFMAVSGVVTKPYSIQLPKRLKILVPFFVFGLGWALIHEFSVLDFFSSEAKLGYWYLYVLVVYYGLIALCAKLPFRLEWGMLMIQLFLMLLHIGLHHTVAASVLSTDHLFQLWPFFCLGILFRQGLLAKLLSRETRAYAISLFGLFILFGGGKLIGINGTLEQYVNDVASVFIVSLCFMLFSKLESKHVSNNVVSAIGRNTLQIYVLHYYVLYLWKVLVGHVIESSLFVDIFVSPLIAFAVCMLCIFASTVMHKIHLGWMFGR